MRAASERAKKERKPVAVEELTSETTQTVANADGTFTLTDHVQPVRVKRDGSWSAVDATLGRNGDGTFSPRATPAGLALSGGGSGPLATLTDAKGRRLSVTFPVALPAPAVTGDSATYGNVLPGVDLRVIANDQGGLREVLVVHDATAAADPALKSLKLAVATSDGLTVAADENGSVTARTADGTTAFTAPTPVMWDSSTTAGTVAARPAEAPAPAARKGELRSARVDEAPPAAAAPTRSTEREPGTGAQLKRIAVTAEAGALTLVPDAGLLTGPDTVWPLYIDPSVSPVTNGTSHYATVREGCPGIVAYDEPQDNGQGAGYQHWNDCQGLYRSFYQIDTSNLTGDMVVSRSEFHITETYGASFDCNHTAPVSLATVSELATDTKWSKQPWVTGDGWLGGAQYPKSSNISNHCGNHEAVFNVTGQMQKLVGHNSNWTVGIFGNETKSSGNNDFMRFNTNPYVVTVFDIAPNAPDMISVSPQPHSPDSNGCDGVNIGWIGNSGTTGSASNITLNARLSTKMSGVNLQAMAHVWDNMSNDGGGNPASKSWPWSASVSNWGTVYDNVGFTVEDGHQYGWNMIASDGTLTGPSSPYCYFNVDLTPPSIPTVADNAAFPPLGSDRTPTGHAGATGAKVRVTANDPVPGGCTRGSCVSSGIDRFEYSLDANIPGGGPSVPAVQAAGGTATADVPISVSSAQWGTHTLFVRAVDKAGNTQGTVAQYSFFAPFDPSAKVAPGDLNGDGVPDLAATTTAGDLVRVPGGGSTEDLETISTPATSPDGTGWNNYLVAHRGTLTAAMADDLFAYQKTTHKLYLYQNDANTAGGTTGHFTLTQNVVPLNNSAGCPAKGSDGTWNKVTQILAPGKLAQMADVPDLVTVDNAELWYFPGTYQAGCNLAAGVKIGTGDWSRTTLLAPGTVNGVPTLWARENATGAVSSFPLTFDGNGVPTTRITAPTRAPLTSGVLDTAGKNMCLDINGSNTANGTPAQMYSCNTTDAQSAALGTDGSVHLLGKCLDVSRGGLDNGSPVQLWDCNGTGAQKWVPGPFAGSLLNPQSGRCLADPAASNTPKTQLILWDCLTDHAEQVWAATTTGKALPPAQPVLPTGLGDRLAPTVASPGDVDGDGNPDLYGTSATGTVTRLPGARTPAAQAADRWRLTDTTDSRRANDLTVAGGAAVGPDATRGTVLNLPGGTGYAVSATGSVDTRKSYTVSAWVKPGDLANTSVFVSQGGTNNVGLQLYYSAWAHAFAFGRNVDDSAVDTFNAVYGPTTGGLSPRLNTWTHLTGVYDAGTKQLQLFVNGAAAGAAAYAGTEWNATGPVQIGRRVLAGGYAQYATGAVGDVVIVPSALPATAAAALATDTAQFDAPVLLGDVHRPTDRWRLTNSADEIRPANSLTVSGSASFVNDTTRGTVLGLSGATDALATTGGPVVDTARSYSVSAWAYLTGTNDYATVAAQSGTSVSAFYLQYSKAFNAWTFVSPSGDSTGPASYPAAFASKPPALNTWTHLVATYDAPGQTMSLYVNGKLAATAVNSTPWASTGPLTIGSAKNGNSFPGRISDVQTWTSALSPAAVASLDSEQPVLTQLV
ncbi:LamG-like jellyroll fold domain-containing protein [Kitasatospora sp. NPDC059973]|uniref:LamG-like jellyroll fold domain-containing protein n=1 Tax=Kitasatospora sp. NPDC059973 TaxID=3347020 RepID=UPI003687E798